MTPDVVEKQEQERREEAANRKKEERQANNEPQECHMTIAETLPDGLFNLSKTEDHLTIHQVCISCVSRFELSLSYYALPT